MQDMQLHKVEFMMTKFCCNYMQNITSHYLIYNEDELEVLRYEVLELDELDEIVELELELDKVEQVEL